MRLADVTKVHLLRLCNETIRGHLSFENLNTLAFAIIMSESFIHEESDEITDSVLYDWDNPETGFPLNMENMRKWKDLLEHGVNRFDRRELKQNKKK